MSVKLFQRLLLSALLTFSAVVYGEVIRDYYEEPGINPFKESLNQNFNELIDPFSGGVSLSYVDLKVPGNGGLDIVVNRIYNSVQNSVGPRTVNGVGWTIHFGRIVASDADSDKLCNQNLWSVSVVDNPSLERPDGGREILFLADDPDAYLITRSRWKAECVGGQPGLVVTAPDGTVYTMDQYDNTGSEAYWYTSRIEDTNGNSIDITYKNPGGLFTYIDEVRASDGRLVQFNYDFEGTTSVRLKTVVANNQIWEYKYSAIPGLGGGQEQLVEVIRPDGKRWLYDYNPFRGEVGVAGDYSLKQVTYPYGSTISYTYKYVNFDPGSGSSTAAIATKTVGGGPNVTPGIWTFDYVPASTAGGAYDKTTVQTPNGKHVYYHYGYSGTGSGSVWQVGLLYSKEIYNNAGFIIDQVVNTWGAQVISSENYWHGRDSVKIDNNTAAPLLLKREHWRDDWVYATDYLNYDAYGNPGQTVEPDNIINGDTRTTTFTYNIDPAKWIINQLKDETFTSIGTVTRAFDAAGNLLTEDRYGVLTAYTYRLTGDVATLTNARNKTTTFSNYFRGVARQEDQPEQVSLSRTVNANGTVASQTNGRGHTTGFSYDSLNRLTAIDFPINADVSVVWTNNGKRLTRDNLEEEVTFDGFGRAISTTRKDLLTSISITTTLQYDALGNKVFESYPNSLDGTAFTYDPLGRVTRIDHPDLTFRALTYTDPLESGIVLETDERGNATKRLYRAFGHPDNRELVRIDSPENMTTIIGRNLLGQIISVWQGDSARRSGFQRDYVYDARYYLTQRTDPERGDTLFGRDAMGNMISKTIATDPTIFYTYDGLDRLATVDYPNVTDIDVSYTYDKNSNIATLNNSISQQVYTYDFNNNLSSEAATISGVAYNTGYQYSATDVLSSITYPSRREVTYAPDAFGRPTEVAPYLASVAYYPSGQVQQMVYANGHVTDIELNNRLFIQRISTLGATDLTYGYDGVGNVTSITDAIDSPRSLTLGYDGMNRLTVADGQWGTGTFEYDLQSNIKSQVLGSKSLTYSYSSNRLTRVRGSSSYTLSYFPNGSVETDSLYQYAYDAAGNLRTGELLASGTGGGSGALIVPFAYDANNMRVVRNSGSAETRYLFAQNGNLLGEYGNISANDLEYAYLGSQLVARVKGNPPPNADAGADQIVNEGSLVALDGTNSSDFASTITGYNWTQLSGPTVTLAGATTAAPTFTATAGLFGGTTLVFELTVTNALAESDTDQITITTQVIDVDADGLSDFWETQYFGDLTKTGSGDSDGDGFTNLEEFQNGTGPTTPDPMPAVAGLTAQAGNAQATLTWAPVERALTYDIYWSTQPGVTTTNGTRIASVTSPYLHSGLTNGLKLYYILVANNTCCQSVSTEISVIPGISGWVGPSFLQSGQVSNYKLSGYINGYAAVAYPTSTSGTVVDNKIHSTLYDDNTGWQASVTHDSYQQPNASLERIPGSPAIVRNADGSALITWWRLERTTDTVTQAIVGEQAVLYAQTYTPGTGWNNATEVWRNTDTTRTEPLAQTTWSSLKADSAGNATLAFKVLYDNTSGRTEEVIYATQYQSAGWGAVTELAYTGALTFFDPFLEAALGVSDAGALVTYKQGPTSGAAPLYVHRYTPASGWGIATPLGNGERPFAVVDATGDAAVAWFGSGLVQVKRYLSIGGWQPTKAVGSGIGGILLGSNVQAAFDTQGALHVAWSRNGVFDNSSGPICNLVAFDLPNGGQIAYNRYVPGSGWGTESILPAAMADDVDFCGHHSFEFGFVTDDNGNAHILAAELAENQTDLSFFVGILDYPFHSGGGLRAPLEVHPFTQDAPSSTFVKAAGDSSGNMLALYCPPSCSNEVASSQYRRIPGAPFANAGANQDTQAGATVQLDAAASTDSGGLIQSYNWMQVEGPTVVLSASNVVSPTFTAPPVSAPTEVTFTLTVQDDAGLADVDSVRVTVFPVSTPPVANAGPDQSVSEGSLVMLDGTASSDTDGSIVAYQWTQTVEPFVVLDYPTSPTPSFTAPQVDGSATLNLTLTVTDDAGLTATDTVIVTVSDALNVTPTANAGLDQTLIEGSTVSLDGSASADSDGVITAYLWTQTSGPLVTLDDPTLALPGFTAPLVNLDTLLGFDLTVTDDLGATGTDGVIITVQDNPDTIAPVTTVSLIRTTVKGAAVYDIDFTVDEPATTWFRVTGDGTITSGGTNTTAWQSYSGTTVRVDIAKSGTANLDYYSVDSAGNTEVIRTEVLQ